MLNVSTLFATISGLSYSLPEVVALPLIRATMSSTEHSSRMVECCVEIYTEQVSALNEVETMAYPGHTSCSNVVICSMLRGKPSRSTPSLPSSSAVPIADLSSIIDRSAGTMTEFFILSSINSPNRDPGLLLSSRKRSPIEICPRLNSAAARAH